VVTLPRNSKQRLIMGYRTYFTLQVNGKEGTQEEQEIISLLRSENEDAEYAFDDDGIPQMDASWHNYEDDMRQFSKRFPNELFVLSGEGDEQGDLWNSYFKNGKHQHCPAVITYEEYNEQLLK